MTVRMRHTHGHTCNRRSHHALAIPRLSKCVKCGNLHLRHYMCKSCGTYRGRAVVDVMKKILKTEQKRKDNHEAKTGKPSEDTKTKTKSK